MCITFHWPYTNMKHMLMLNSNLPNITSLVTNRGGRSRGAWIFGKKNSLMMHIHIGIIITRIDGVYLNRNKMKSFSQLKEGYSRPAILTQLGRNGSTPSLWARTCGSAHSLVRRSSPLWLMLLRVTPAITFKSNTLNVKWRMSLFYRSSKFGSAPAVPVNSNL